MLTTKRYFIPNTIFVKFEAERYTYEKKTALATLQLVHLLVYPFGQGFGGWQ